MIDSADADFLGLTKKIARDRGFGCSSYKERCLRRRIAVRMRACGVHTYADYARVLDADGAEYDRLIDALTINVTKLFRNWDVYAYLAEHVLPALWESCAGPLRVWSAGCASGEEPYSLAVLFHDHVANHGSGPIERLEVLGTDIDLGSLSAAERGTYSTPAFAETPEPLRRRYFSGDEPFQVAPTIRRSVRFARHDLLRDPVPHAAYHLIACRNVLIYFDRDTQEALFEIFHTALVPGGVLLLGKVETLLGPARPRFTPVNGRERIFRRL